MFGELVDELVNLVLGPDVDAAGGFVEDDDLGVALEPLGENDLLLIAARKRAGDLLRAGDLDLNLVNVSGEGLSFLFLPDEAARGEVAEVRQTEVFADRLAEDESLCLAIFGQQANALPNGIPRVVDGERLAVESNAAAVGSVGAEKQSRRLGATGSDEPCQAKHLASPNLERHILHPLTAIEGFDDQAGLAGRGVAFRKLLVETAADHQFDHLLAGEALDGARVDVLAVPQEGDAVGDLKNLIEPVADINDPDTLRFQFVDHPEQSLGFAGGEGGAGFIHHDDACILRECLGDLDDLLLGDGEAVALGVDRHLHADALKQCLRPRLLAGEGNEADAS